VSFKVIKMAPFYRPWHPSGLKGNSIIR